MQTPRDISLVYCQRHPAEAKRAKRERREAKRERNLEVTYVAHHRPFTGGTYSNLTLIQLSQLIRAAQDTRLQRVTIAS